jgi:hypothetical protein
VVRKNESKCGVERQGAGGRDRTGMKAVGCDASSFNSPGVATPAGGEKKGGNDASIDWVRYEELCGDKDW